MIEERRRGAVVWWVMSAPRAFLKTTGGPRQVAHFERKIGIRTYSAHGLPWGTLEAELEPCRGSSATGLRPAAA